MSSRIVLTAALVVAAVVGVAGFFGTRHAPTVGSLGVKCPDGWTSYIPLNPKPGEDACQLVGSVTVTTSGNDRYVTETVSSAEWKAVIRDAYDKGMDRPHSCAATQKAVDALPHDSSQWGSPGTVSGVLLAYEKTVC